MGLWLFYQENYYMPLDVSNTKHFQILRAFPKNNKSSYFDYDI